jgi:hypothetical protein
VEVRVSLAGGDVAGELESLDDWLQGEPELAGRVKMPTPAPRRGELGALADVLVVAVGSGGTLSVLAASLHAWLSQPRRSDVRVRVQRGEGRVVEIDAHRIAAEQVGALVRDALGSDLSEG